MTSSAALLLPAARRNARPEAPTKRCADVSCNWAHSHIDLCTCACGGHGHGGAFRVTEMCGCGEIAGECFC